VKNLLYVLKTPNKSKTMKLRFLGMLLALLFIPFVVAKALPGLQIFFSETVNPGTTVVSLPTAGSNIRAVKVTVQLRVNWWIGCENLSSNPGSPFYFSWNYNAHGRWPYAWEIGTPGDNLWELIPSIAGVNLGSVSHSMNIINPPLGAYDGTMDWGGTSGTIYEENDGWTTSVVFTSTNSTVLNALKSGADLDLITNFSSYAHFLGGSGAFQTAISGYAQGGVEYIY